ncbi:MAG: hypothetical protein AAB390_00715 [Patescibacteria group bacterium]
MEGSILSLTLVVIVIFVITIIIGTAVRKRRAVEAAAPTAEPFRSVYLNLCPEDRLLYDRLSPEARITHFNIRGNRHE